jgi:hypothetical protein
MIKITKYSIIAIVVIGTLAAGYGIYSFAKTGNSEVSANYYDKLEEECNMKSSPDCCKASVARMREGNHKLTENESCPNGYESNILRCIDSYKWCEPKK